MRPWPQRRMSRRTWLGSAGALLLAACGLTARGRDAGSGLAPQLGPVALLGGRVWREGATEPAGVLSDGGSILAVGRDVAAGDAATTIDCTGLVLLPGFVDTHVHVRFARAQDVLLGGVTTVRDLGSTPEDRAAWQGVPVTVRAAGRILTPLGGYPTRSWGGRGESREVADADDARAAVDEQVAAGAVIVKIALEDSGGRPLFAPDVLAAAVDAAHAAGLRVTAHVGTADGLRLALDASVDELAHLPLYAIGEDEAADLAMAGMALCPTLAIRGRDDGATRAVAAFREAGGRVLYSTDLGNGGTRPGIMGEEFAALRASGMSAAEVVDAATVEAADHLGLDRVGRVEPGWRADVIGVAVDPAGDEPLDAEHVRVVVAGGRPVRTDPA
ncbi:MAG: amidohydrolase family protein [Egibacteraceae bacterium]